MKPLASPLLPSGPHLKIQAVAFDSFGVKAMCTAVRTPEITILIDPGVSAQSEQFPLPDLLRRQLLQDYEAAVIAAARQSEIIVISHYHLDHFLDRRDPELYGGKIIFAKSPDDLPPKQQETARRFFQMIDGLPREVIRADGRRFKFKKRKSVFLQHSGMVKPMPNRGG
jgi:predicted metallo-beta-lactamase superfamily hydrolase